MGNVNMEATQIHDRTEAGKHQSVAEHLAALDAIAKKIDDMPTYTSVDRAWLDVWENKLPELPADPETDGVKVLTATTESGETVKSWETPQSGENQVYSTTPVTVGTWIDGKYLKRVVLPFDATSGSVSIDITDLNIDKAFCGGCYCQEEIYQTYNLAISPLYNSNDDKFSFQINGARTALLVTAGNEKKGHGAIVLYYTEATE